VEGSCWTITSHAAGFYWMDYMNMQFPIYDFYEPAINGTGRTPISHPRPSRASSSMQSRLGHFDFNIGLDYNKTSLGTYAALNSAALPAGNIQERHQLYQYTPHRPSAATRPRLLQLSAVRAVFSGESNAFSRRSR